MEKSSQDSEPSPVGQKKEGDPLDDPSYVGKTFSNNSISNGRATESGAALKKSNRRGSKTSVKSATAAVKPAGKISVSQKTEKKDSVGVKVSSKKGQAESNSNNQAHPNSQFGQFQKVILSTVREKLNMMMSEVCQCKQKKADLDFSNKEKLTHKVLCMIAEKKIKSVHISPEEATRFLKLLEELNCGEDHAVFRDYSVSDHEEGSSPFSSEEADSQKPESGPFSGF